MAVPLSTVTIIGALSSWNVQVIEPARASRLTRRTTASTPANARRLDVIVVIPPSADKRLRFIESPFVSKSSLLRMRDMVAYGDGDLASRPVALRLLPSTDRAILLHASTREKAGHHFAG